MYVFVCIFMLLLILKMFIFYVLLNLVDIIIIKIFDLFILRN